MTPLAVPALTRACCHLPGLMTRSEVRGEIASRDGAGESRPRPRQPAGRCGQPGRVTLCLTPGHLAGPHPALPRPPCLNSHTRCARLCPGPSCAAAARSSARVLIPGPDHSKLSRHAQLTPSVSLSARPPALSRTQPSGMRGR